MNLKNPDLDLIRRIHYECGFYVSWSVFGFVNPDLDFPKKTHPYRWPSKVHLVYVPKMRWRGSKRWFCWYPHTYTRGSIPTVTMATGKIRAIDLFTYQFDMHLNCTSLSVQKVQRRVFLRCRCESAFYTLRHRIRCTETTAPKMNTIHALKVNEENGELAVFDVRCRARRTVKVTTDRLTFSCRLVSSVG